MRGVLSTIILVVAVLNLLRFVGTQDPPDDPITLVGEIVLIVIDITLLITAFRPSGPGQPDTPRNRGAAEMSILNTVSEADATGPVARIYDEDLEEIGYVPSHTKVMAMNPEAVRAWEELVRTIALPLGKRNYELVTLAAAHALRSQHCLLAHGKKSLGLFAEPDLIRIALDYHDAGLTEAEVAMMDFAEKLSTESSTMTDTDSQRLRDVGFSDADIVNIALVAAARNYYSRSIQALAVEVDVPAELSPALMRALVGTLR